MTNREAAEKIEDMFSAQLEDSAMHDALDRLQAELIGEVAVAAMRERRFKEYQEAHKWLYPNIYGPMQPPHGRNQVLTPKQITQVVLEQLKQLKTETP